MATIKIPYFVTRKNEDDSKRYYWQPDGNLRKAGWKQTRLAADHAEAVAEAQEINVRVAAWRAGEISEVQPETPGTIAAVSAAYKKSRFFTEKSETTRKDYSRYLILINDWAGDTPAAAINAKMVQALYESSRKKSPRKAQYLIQVLRLLFSYAERQSIIPKGSNPASRPMMNYTAKKGTIWTPGDVAHFVKIADQMGHFSIGTAVMLNEWMGQRRGDLLKISMRDYRDGKIYITQNKTHAHVALPVDMVPELKARIDLQIEQNKKRKVSGTMLIQQQTGKAFTSDGFMSAFERVRIKAAAEHPGMLTLVLKDLRHTAVTRLAEAGAEIPMIAAVTGHTFKSCQDIVDRYNIRTTKMAAEAFRRRQSADHAATQQNSAGIVPTV